MLTNRLVSSQFCAVARLKWALAPFLITVLCAVAVSVSADGPGIITLDAPGAGAATAPCLNQGTFPYAINDAGAIGGNFQDANNVLHGFLRTPDGDFVAFDAPGAGTGACQGTQGFAINAEGAVAGQIIDPNNLEHGMLRSPESAPITFDIQGEGTGPGQGSLATNINSDGTVLGFYVDSSDVVHAFLRAPDGTITKIDVPGAGTGFHQGTVPCAVDCLNPEGAITGYYADANRVFHGFLRGADGKITTFDVPVAGTGHGQGTAPGAINSEGVIAGVYADANNVNHGFVREPDDGEIATFDVPGAGTGPGQGTLPSGFAGINAQGEITGSYLDANNANHGFLRTKHGAIVKFDAPNAGTGAGQGTFPLDINGKGAITGYYIDASNVGHGFLRTGRRCGDHSSDPRNSCEGE